MPASRLPIPLPVPPQHQHHGVPFRAATKYPTKRGRIGRPLAGVSTSGGRQLGHKLKGTGQLPDVT